MKAWQSHLTERELKEVQLCRLYQQEFSHGTDGHNIRIIVAKLANLLDMGLIPYLTPHVDTSKPADTSKKPATLKD